jgi:hypothetical protein
MPTLRDKALSLFSRARTDLIDAKAGLRRYRVFVRRSVPGDGRGGRGVVWTVTDTELAEKPRVRQANEKEMLRAVGRVVEGAWVLEAITPQNDAATVGTAFDTLDAAPVAVGEQVRIVLVGPDMPVYVAGPPPSGGGEFSVVGSDPTRNFGFRFWIAPAAGKQAPP